MKKSLKKKNFHNFLLINLGMLGTSFAFSFFLSPSNLVVGGVGGIVINICNIVNRLFNLSLTPDQMVNLQSLLIFIINALLLLFAFCCVGKEFAMKTAYCSLIYPIFTFLFSKLYYAVNFHDLLGSEANTVGGLLLLVFFSALLSGVSIGLVIKKGASSGGVDILEQFNLLKFKIPYSATLIIVDGLTVIISSIITKSIYPIFYGAIYIYVSGHLIDSVVFSGFKCFTVTIITKKCDEVKHILHGDIKRGITEVDAQSGVTGNKSKMLVCTVFGNEVSKIRAKLNTIDSDAFMYVTRVSEVNGVGFTKERRVY